MTDREYLAGDDELFQMMARRKPTRKRMVGIVVSVERANELDRLEKSLKHALIMKPIACSALVAAVFFGATILGWVEMAFGAVVTLAAAARAVGLFWRYRHGRK